MSTPYIPLCEHKNLTWMSCPECERLKLLMQITDDMARVIELKAELDAHLAGEHAEMELYR
jgi:hypothetical protein